MESQYICKVIAVKLYCGKEHGVAPHPKMIRANLIIIGDHENPRRVMYEKKRIK